MLTQCSRANCLFKFTILLSLFSNAFHFIVGLLHASGRAYRNTSRCNTFLWIKQSFLVAQRKKKKLRPTWFSAMRQFVELVFGLFSSETSKWLHSHRLWWLLHLLISISISIFPFSFPLTLCNGISLLMARSECFSQERINLNGNCTILNQNKIKCNKQTNIEINKQKCSNFELQLVCRWVFRKVTSILSFFLFKYFYIRRVYILILNWFSVETSKAASKCSCYVLVLWKTELCGFVAHKQAGRVDELDYVN